MKPTELKDVIRCKGCGLLFRPIKKGVSFCSIECAYADYIGNKAKTTTTKIRRKATLEFKHRGSWAEIIASAWLLENDYEVFKNVSSHGPIDIVAIKGREISLIDVKMVTLEMMVSEERLGQAATNGGAVSRSQAEGGIKPLYVSPDGFCSFSKADIRALYTTIYKAHLDDGQSSTSPAA